MAGADRLVKPAMVDIRIHVEGEFLFKRFKTEFVGGKLHLLRNESTSTLTFSRLRFIVDELVDPRTELSLIWYKIFGKDLTCGRTIMKNDGDLEEALRGRDKQGTIDLYVTSQVIDFLRDPQRRSPRKSPTIQMESFDPASSRHMSPTPSKPLLIKALPLRCSPSKETKIVAPKIRAISPSFSAFSALLHPQKQPPGKLQKLTPIRKASLRKSVALKEGICEYGFDTSSGVVTRSVSAGVVKKEVHVGGVRSVQLGKEASAHLTENSKQSQCDSSVVTRTLRGTHVSGVLSEKVSDKAGEQLIEREGELVRGKSGVQLSEKEGDQVRGKSTGQQVRNEGVELVRNEGVEQVGNVGGQQVRSHGEQQGKASAGDSLKQVRRRSKKSKGPSLEAKNNRVVTRSVAEKQEARKKKGKKNVTGTRETREAVANRKAVKGKQSGGDKGKGKVGVKRKKDWESDESFSEEDGSLSEDSEYSELDVPFSFGEQDVDEEKFREKGEGDHNRKAELVRRRSDTQIEFDDSGEDSGDLVSLDGSDDEGDRFPVFNPDVDFKKNIVLKEGLKFPSRQILRKTLVHHAIENKYDYYYLHNGRQRVSTYCKNKCSCKWNKERTKIQCECESPNKCSFKVHVKLVKQEQTYQIRSINLKHSCTFMGHNKKVSSEYLAERYLEEWRDNPNWELKVFQKRVYRDLGVTVSYAVCWLARGRAKLIIYGDGAEQYGRVWDYAAVIIKYNPGSTAIVTVENVERPPILFQRMFICLKPIKDGFLSGCRPILGVDGCHLKGAYPGMCLVAVGKDGNNNIYSVAWAVVEVENGETWSWFLRLLIEDLGKEEGKGLTFMSDRQKGLLDTFSSVAPKAEIRFCVRHIWANFKLQFAGQAFKDGFWRAARSTSKADFDGQMEGIKFLSPAAHAYLASIAPKHGSRHAFSTTCKSNMLLNNMCETFNSVLKQARDKPIITLMEWIRRYIIKRFCEKREQLLRVEGSQLPYVQKHFKWAETEASFCDVTPSNIDEFEVDCKGETYVVNLKERKCSCFHWELTGLPCPHAMTCIIQQRGNKDTYVDAAYSKETYAKAYEPSISAMPGMRQWERVGHSHPLPPPFRRLPGRPSHKKRRKEAGEGTSTQLKRPRKPRACGKCGQLGHNIKSCKNEAVVKQADARPAVREKSTSGWSNKNREKVAKRKAENEASAAFISNLGGTQASVNGPPSSSQSSAPVFDRMS